MMSTANLNVFNQLIQNANRNALKSNNAIKKTIKNKAANTTNISNLKAVFLVPTIYDKLENTTATEHDLDFFNTSARVNCHKTHSCVSGSTLQTKPNTLLKSKKSSRKTNRNIFVHALPCHRLFNAPKFTIHSPTISCNQRFSTATFLNTPNPSFGSNQISAPLQEPHDFDRSNVSPLDNLDSYDHIYSFYSLEGTSKAQIAHNNYNTFQQKDLDVSTGEAEKMHAFSNLCTFSTDIIHNRSNESSAKFIEILNSLIDNKYQIASSLSPTNFINVLRAIKRIRRKDQYKFILYLVNEILRHREIRSDEYPLMISILGRAGDWKSATMLFDMAPPFDFISDMQIKSSIMHALLINNKVDEANYIWNQVFENTQIDKVTYTILIHQLVNTNQFHKALAMYKQLQDNEIPIDQYTYAAMIRGAASQAGEQPVDLIHEFLSAMVKSKIKPSVTVLNSVILGFLSASNYTLAEWVLKKLHEFSVKRNFVTWVLAVKTYIGSAQLDKLQLELENFKLNENLSFSNVNGKQETISFNKRSREYISNLTKHWTHFEFEMVIHGYTKLGLIKEAILYCELAETTNTTLTKKLLSTKIRAYSYAANFLFAKNPLNPSKLLSSNILEFLLSSQVDQKTPTATAEIQSLLLEFGLTSLDSQPQYIYETLENFDSDYLAKLITIKSLCLFLEHFKNYNAPPTHVVESFMKVIFIVFDEPSLLKILDHFLVSLSNPKQRIDFLVISTESLTRAKRFNDRKIYTSLCNILVNKLIEQLELLDQASQLENYRYLDATGWNLDNSYLAGKKVLHQLGWNMVVDNLKISGQTEKAINTLYLMVKVSIFDNRSLPYSTLISCLGDLNSPHNQTQEVWPNSLTHPHMKILASKVQVIISGVLDASTQLPSEPNQNCQCIISPKNVVFAKKTLSGLADFLLSADPFYYAEFVYRIFEFVSHENQRKRQNCTQIHDCGAVDTFRSNTLVSTMSLLAKNRVMYTWDKFYKLSFWGQKGLHLAPTYTAMLVNHLDYRDRAFEILVCVFEATKLKSTKGSDYTDIITNTCLNILERLSNRNDSVANSNEIIRLHDLYNIKMSYPLYSSMIKAISSVFKIRIFNSEPENKHGVLSTEPHFTTALLDIVSRAKNEEVPLGIKDYINLISYFGLKGYIGNARVVEKLVKDAVSSGCVNFNTLLLALEVGFQLKDVRLINYSTILFSELGWNPVYLNSDSKKNPPIVEINRRINNVLYQLFLSNPEHIIGKVCKHNAIKSNPIGDEKREEILSLLFTFYQFLKKSDVKPDIITVTSLLDGLRKLCACQPIYNKSSNVTTDNIRTASQKILVSLIVDVLDYNFSLDQKFIRSLLGALINLGYLSQTVSIFNSTKRRAFNTPDLHNQSSSTDLDSLQYEFLKLTHYSLKNNPKDHETHKLTVQNEQIICHVPEELLNMVKNVVPNMYAYNEMIQLYLNMGQPITASNLLYEAVSLEKQCPTFESFEPFIKYFNSSKTKDKTSIELMKAWVKNSMIFFDIPFDHSYFAGSNH